MSIRPFFLILGAPVLVPLSWIYRLAMKVRGFFYDTGICMPEECGAFVVSVGNIQAGGTGKTPFTQLLLDRWGSGAEGGLSLRAGVVSRGYKKKATGIQKVESHRKDAAFYYGDEPAYLAEVTGVAVYVGNKKAKAAQELVAKEGVRLVLIDDGFQHRKIKRHLDIVLIDTSAPYWHFSLLPWGRLRESLSELKRADAIILSKTESLSTQQLGEFKKFVSRQIGALAKKKRPLISMVQEARLPLAAINKKIFLVAGLARPENFFSLVQSMHKNVVGVRPLPDHFSYPLEVVREIFEEARQNGASAVLTTGKDLIKLKPIWDEAGFEMPIFSVELRLLPREEVDQRSLEELDEIAVNKAHIFFGSHRR